MTTPAQITVDFVSGAVGSQYYIHSSVNAYPATTPAELVKCLLIRAATSTQEEQCVRVCTVAEIETVTDTPDPLTILYAPSMGTGFTVNPGDVVTITSPSLWIEMGYPATFTTTVASIPSAWVPAVELTVPMPIYASDLTFHIASSPVINGTDGVARRAYNTNWIEPDAYFRINDYWSVFDELPDAINKLSSLEAEAQGLVTSFNDYGTEFSGSFHEVYT